MNNDVCGTRLWQKSAQENEMNEEYSCEFCGKIKPEESLESTSIVGFYCADCHKIVIEQSREAIKEIKARAKRKRNKK